MYNFNPSKKLTKSVSTLELALFFRQLAALLSAGIPIVQSCEILRHSQQNKTLRSLITSMKINMEAGNELSRCLSKFPRYFDTLLCRLVQTGEQSGTLPMALERIALHKEKQLSIKNKIKHALFYPAIVMLTALVVSVTMLTVVIPRFAELFQNMHTPLPVFTLAVIQLSKWLRTYFGLVLLPLPAFFLLACYSRYSASLRYSMERLILQTPYFGSMYAKTILARFCRTLAATYAAGIPVSESLKTIAYANGSDFYAQAILKLRVQLVKGQQLHQAMHNPLLFPPMLVQMVKIGEESGTLERMLEKTASIYESEIEHFISNFGRLLEPLIIMILGVLIGGLVIAMYLPIFKLGTVM